MGEKGRNFKKEGPAGREKVRWPWVPKRGGRISLGRERSGDKKPKKQRKTVHAEFGFGMTVAAPEEGGKSKTQNRGVPTRLADKTKKRKRSEWGIAAPGASMGSKKRLAQDGEGNTRSREQHLVKRGENIGRENTGMHLAAKKKGKRGGLRGGG